MSIDIPVVTIAIILMAFFLSTIYGIPILIIMHTKMKRSRDSNSEAFENSYCSMEEGRHIEADTMSYTAFEDKYAQEMCLICLQEFKEHEQITKINCKHIFHSNCISKWIQVKLICPICSKGC